MTVAFFSKYIKPDDNLWIIAITGLFFGEILLVNFIFFIFNLLLKNKFYKIYIILFALNIFHFFTIFNYNFSNDKKVDENKSIKIISFNVHLFDVYWDNTTRKKLLFFLEKQNADIICLQEFYNDDTDKFPVHSKIMKFKGLKNCHLKYTYTGKKFYHYGIATYSKYKIINRRTIKLVNSNNVCISSDLLYLGDTIRVFNLHLQSNKLNPDNIEKLDNIENRGEIKSLWQNIKPTLYQMKKAYKKRNKQSEKINAEINNSPYPVLLCGDFNDVPISYTYNKITEKLTDSFRKQGSLFGKSFVKKNFSFRIDYIMHDKNFKTNSFKTYSHINLSDHKPIESIISLQK